MAAPKGHAKYGGRVAGTPNKATAEIRDLARADGPAVFKELVRLALESKNEQTRVAPRTPSASIPRRKANPINRTNRFEHETGNPRKFARKQAS